MANIAGYVPLNLDREVVYLQPCNDCKTYRETLEKIHELLGDSTKIGKIVDGNLEIKNKSKVDKARSWLHLNSDGEVKKCIEKFLEQNQRWNRQVQGTIDSLLQLPLLQRNCENIKFFQDFVPTRETPTKIPSDLKTLRGDRASADVFFLFGQHRIFAHKAVLKQIPYFAKTFDVISADQPYGEDISHVADIKTVEIFLDVMYGTVDVRACPLEEYLIKFKRFFDHLKDENMLRKFLEQFEARLGFYNSLGRTDVFQALLRFPCRCIPFRLFDLMCYRAFNHLKIIESHLPNPMTYILLGKSQSDLWAKSELSEHLHYKKEKDFFDKKAFDYYNEAVKKDPWPPALFELGVCYLYAHGVEKNEELGFAYIHEAAQAGYANGFIALGYYFSYVPEKAPRPAHLDFGRALEYFACALSLPFDESQADYVQRSVERCQNELREKAAADLKQQEEEGKRLQLLRGLLTLSLDPRDMYLAAEGHERRGDMVKAIQLYRRAAGLGYEKALRRMDALGDMQQAIKVSMEAANGAGTGP